MTGGFGATGMAALSNPIAGAAVALGSLAIGAYKVGSAVVDWTQGLLNAQKHLAEFSASMGQVFALSEARDIERNFRLGENTAGTTGQLSEVMSDVQDLLEPIQEVLTDFYNLVGTTLLEAVKAILEPLSAIFKAVTLGFNKLDEDKEKGESPVMSQEALQRLGAASDRWFDLRNRALDR